MQIEIDLFAGVRATILETEVQCHQHNREEYESLYAGALWHCFQVNGIRL